MKQLASITIAIALIAIANFSEAQTMRATEMDHNKWAQLYAGQIPNMSIEFREGDELPVNFVTEGDLFQTTRQAPSYITVKRNFWLKFNNNTLLMSFNGVDYKPFTEVVGGTFAAGVNNNESGDIQAHSIQLNLNMSLKK